MDATEIAMEVFSYARFMAQSGLLDDTFIWFDVVNGVLSLHAYPISKFCEMIPKDDLHGIVQSMNEHIIMSVCEKNQTFTLSAYKCENYQHVHRG